MLRFEWLLCCHFPVSNYFRFTVWDWKSLISTMRFCWKKMRPRQHGLWERLPHLGSCVGFSCCTGGAINHRSNLLEFGIKRNYVSSYTGSNLTSVHSNQTCLFKCFYSILFPWQAETCRVDSAPAAILEQAGQLKDILWSVNFFQEDEAERMPANYSREKKQLEQEGWKTSPFACCDVFLSVMLYPFFKEMVKSIDNNQPPTTTHHHHNSNTDNKNKRKKLYSPR